jgi:hypothetical protein
MEVIGQTNGLARLRPPLAFFLPERGAPRPIRLGVKRTGQLDPIPLTLP